MSFRMKLLLNNGLNLSKNGKNSLLCLPNMCNSRLYASMKAWQVQEKGLLDDLKLETVRVPPIIRPTDVLVSVHAASVNPLDAAMIEGYGKDVIGLLKTFEDLQEGVIECNRSTFPLIGGRDFSGEVVALGHDVKDVSIGDKVYGVVSPQAQGCHTEYVVTSNSNIRKVPEGIEMAEASSIPYAGLTSWSAIVVSGGVLPYSAAGVRAVVLGAAGGVGTSMVQILRAWGAQVTGVCSEDSFELVMSLGADDVLNYKDPQTKHILTSMPCYDLILDASGQNNKDYVQGLKKWTGATYVSLTPPLLRNTDELGIIGGFVKSAGEAILSNVNNLSEGRAHTWGFYMPNPYAFNDIQDMLKSGRLRPVLDQVFPFDEAPEAYKHVIKGPNRGKTIIEMKS